MDKNIKTDFEPGELYLVKPKKDYSLFIYDSNKNADFYIGIKEIVVLILEENERIITSYKGNSYIVKMIYNNQTTFSFFSMSQFSLGYI